MVNENSDEFTKKEIIKKSVKTFYLSTESINALHEMAKELNMSLSEIVEHSILGRYDSFLQMIINKQQNG